MVTILNSASLTNAPLYLPSRPSLAAAAGLSLISYRHGREACFT